MYRIAKIAELLEVTTVQIHEKLVLFRRDMSDSIIKKSGLTYVDEKGLLFLKSVFENEKHEEEDTKVKEEPIVEENAEEEVFLDEDEQREIDLLELKDQLNRAKSDLYKMEVESRKLDTAIEHYLNVLAEKIT